MFITNLGKKFHISIFLAVVLKAELGMATVLLFYILPKKKKNHVTLTPFASFSKICYSTATNFQSPISRGPSRAVITQVLAFAVLLVIVHYYYYHYYYYSLSLALQPWVGPGLL